MPFLLAIHYYNYYLQDKSVLAIHYYNYYLQDESVTSFFEVGWRSQVQRAGDIGCPLSGGMRDAKL